MKGPKYLKSSTQLLFSPDSDVKDEGFIEVYSVLLSLQYSPTIGADV